MSRLSGVCVQGAVVPTRAVVPIGSVSRTPAQRTEGVLEYFIRHASAQGDAVCFVERPVYPEIDPALAVLLLGLGQRREAARTEGPHRALVVLGHTVELVRHEGEGDAIGAVEPAQRLEKGASESGVAGRIGRKRRCEVGAVEIAGRRAERHERRISLGGRIAVAPTGGATALVGLADAGDRPPESIVIFRLPDRDT